jgi:hypothetical protein
MNREEKRRRLVSMARNLAPDPGVLESLASEESSMNRWAEAARVSEKDREPAQRAVRKVATGQDLADEEEFALEAIVRRRAGPSSTSSPTGISRPRRRGATSTIRLIGSGTTQRSPRSAASRFPSTRRSRTPEQAHRGAL